MLRHFTPSLFHRHAVISWIGRSGVHASSSFSTSFPFFTSNKVSSSSSTSNTDKTSEKSAPASTATEEQQEAILSSMSEYELKEEWKKTREELSEKSQKLTQMVANYHRALADAENLRTRAKRDVEQAHLYALQSFAKDLLTTADTLALAIASVTPDALHEHAPLKLLHEGLVNTNDAFHATLHRFGVQRMDVVEGDPFQPHLHHALYEVAQPNRVPGTLLHVLKSGYLLNGRVLRPAQVGVVQEPLIKNEQINQSLIKSSEKEPVSAEQK